MSTTTCTTMQAATNCQYLPLITSETVQTLDYEYPQHLQGRPVCGGIAFNVRWSVMVDPQGFYAGYVKFPENHPWRHDEEVDLQRKLVHITMEITHGRDAWFGFSSRFGNYRPDPQQALKVCPGENDHHPVYKRSQARLETLKMAFAVRRARLTERLAPYWPDLRHQGCARIDTAIILYDRMLTVYGFEKMFDRNRCSWTTNFRVDNGIGAVRDLSHHLSPAILDIHEAMTRDDSNEALADLAYDLEVVPAILDHLEEIWQEIYSAARLHMVTVSSTMRDCIATEVLASLGD